MLQYRPPTADKDKREVRISVGSETGTAAGMFYLEGNNQLANRLHQP
jgi:hypothetical protein